MQRKLLTMAAACLLLTGCETLDTAAMGNLLSIAGGTRGELTPETIAAGLKEALNVGTRQAVASASKSGGYADNPLIHIPLPEQLSGVAKTLRRVGMDSLVDPLEAKMNAAAEEAAAQATPIFLDAIRSMTIADAKQILGGGATAATDYFRGKTADALRAAYAPIVTRHIQKVGAAQVYDNMIGRYNAIPLVPKATFSLENYVTDQGIGGLFKLVAAEETKIRENPAARTTDLLRRVFGH